MVVNITFLSFLLFSMCKSIHDAVNTWINCSFFILIIIARQRWTIHEVFLLTPILCSNFVSIEFIVSNICPTKYFANLA